MVHVYHHLTPELIERILGKPDAVTMKEELDIAIDQQHDVKERVRALDHLEMLVENSDNAENLTHLQMYPLLLDLASSEHLDHVRREALWILEMAMKNNSKAQLELLKYEPLRKILPILQTDSASDNNPSGRTRSIAIDAIISILHNNTEGICRMDYHRGWCIIRNLLEDTDAVIRREAAFLIWTLLQPDNVPCGGSACCCHQIHHHHDYPGIHMRHNTSCRDVNVLPVVKHSVSIHTRDAMQKHGIVHALVESLVKFHPNAPPGTHIVDDDYAAEAVKSLIAYIVVGGKFSSTEKEKLRPLIENPITRCTWGLDQSKWKLLVNCINEDLGGI